MAGSAVQGREIGAREEGLREGPMMSPPDGRGGIDQDLLADRTAAWLRARIVAGELAAGDRIIESQVAEDLGVSRGPVRDAFKQLAREGLLHDIPRRGTYVVQLEASDVVDLLDLRAGIEGRAARLIVEQGHQSTVRDLDAAVRRLADACRDGDEAAISEADYRFHEAVVLATGNGRLHEVFVRYVTELRVLLRSDEERLHEAGADISGQHLQLLRALEAGDAAFAGRAFERHVEETRDRLVGPRR